MDSFVFHAILVVGRASLPIPAHFVRIDSFIRPELQTARGEALAKVFGDSRYLKLLRNKSFNDAVIR